MPPHDDRTEVRSESGGERRSARFVSGDVLAGRYRIVAPLGTGGMGEVYRAEDVRLGQQVALKFLPHSPVSDPRMLERLVSEVRIGRQISHPNICRLYDLVEAPDGVNFIAMEFVEGEDLASLLRRIGRIPHDKAISLSEELCGGLAAAHDAGVIHRDLKPANIMIDQKGHAKITDFGLALARPDARHGDWAGTPAYMSPEQLMAEPAGIRSDIYSLGLVLYEMFTGRRVFESNEVDELRRLHRQPKLAPSAIVHDIDPKLERLILSAIAETPEQRPASARELLDQLPGRVGASRSSPPISRQPLTPSSQREARSIAVIPFEDLSPDKADEYFSAGLAEEIISDLSKIGSIRVISRGSVMRYRGLTDVPAIANELQVTYVLTGSMRKAGNQLRVTANLIDGRNDNVVWSEKFRGTIDDIFEIQETVARGVAEQLKIKLSDEENARISERPIPNAVAYESFLKARNEVSKFTPDGIARALELLQKGLEIVGPNIHLHAAMAYAHWQYFNAGIDPSEETLQKAEHWVRQIRQMEPDSPHADRMAGLIAMSRGDVTGTIASLTRATRAEPNDSESLVWLSMLRNLAGHGDIGRALSERVQKLDPLGLFAQWAPCLSEWFDGNFAGAAAIAGKVWEQEPDNIITAHAHTYMLALARDPAAQRKLGQMEQQFGETFFTNTTRLVVHAAAGDRDAALAAVTPEVEQLARNDLQYSLTVAEGLATAGDLERAFAFLENAITRGILAHEFMAKRDWMLDPLKSAPRFHALMERARERSEALRREIPA